MPIKSKIILLFSALLILGISSWDKLAEDSGDKNLYVQQAQAFLQGRLDVDAQYYDTAVYQGKFYVSFPPFPTLLLLPFVALLGVAGTKVVLIAIGLSLINIAVLIQILEKLNLNSNQIFWLTAAFFLGTGYWIAVRASSGVWFFAHIVAVGCMLLAINEALGRGVGILAGLFLGLAFLTRQLSIYHFIFLGAALWQNPHSATRQQKVLNVLGFGAVLGLCVGGYLLFNWLRFGSLFDTGYTHIPLAANLKARVDQFGIFNIAYVPFNFIYMFLQGFHLEFKPPAFLDIAGVDPYGTSLTIASPFIFAALRAKWDKGLLWPAWASVCLTLVHLLFYYNNGSLQWNTQRFALDFLPVLIVLVALGSKQTDGWLWKIAIVWSVLLNILTIFVTTQPPR